MTRFCMDCKKLLGEKCARCGSTNLSERNYTDSTTGFHCHGCGHNFRQGEGGNTDGCCAECVEKRNHERQARRSA
jgi:transposase-like protein